MASIYIYCLYKSNILIHLFTLIDSVDSESDKEDSASEEEETESKRANEKNVKTIKRKKRDKILVKGKRKGGGKHANKSSSTSKKCYKDTKKKENNKREGWAFIIFINIAVIDLSNSDILIHLYIGKICTSSKNEKEEGMNEAPAEMKTKEIVLKKKKQKTKKKTSKKKGKYIFCCKLSYLIFMQIVKA